MRGLQRFLVLGILYAVFAVAHAQVFVHLSPKDYAVADTLPEYCAKFSTGVEAGNATFQVSLDYPEYHPLTQAETAAADTLLPDRPMAIEVNTALSVHRKKTLMEISFVPIVYKDGTWQRLVSFKPVITVIASDTASTTTATRSLTTQATATRAATTGSSRYASSSVLASGSWVKIRVKDEGIYQLTTSDLANAGFSDPSKVKLYGYGGRPIEEVFDFDSDDRLIDDLEEVPLLRMSDGRLLFFSEGTIRWEYSSGTWTHTNNTYSSYAYYFLTEGDSPISLTEFESSSVSTTSVSITPHHALVDDDAYSWYEGGDEFYDSYDFANGQTHSFTLSAPGMVEGETGYAYIAFSASSLSSSTTTSITLNDETLGSLSISAYGDNESAREARSLFTTSALQESNTFTFTTSNTNAARLNYIRLSYPRALAVSSVPYSFVPTPSSSSACNIVMTNANTDTHLWMLGRAGAPTCEVAYSLSGTTLTAPVDDGSRSYVAFDASQTFDTPEYVGTIENQDLHADKAYDYVIIIPASGALKEEAERLAAVHSDLRVKIVRADQIYNEFSSGTPDASAYRRYLKMLYDRAESDDDMPRYLLLFGDCAWDNRMLTSAWSGYDPDDYLLAYEKNSSSTSIGTLRCYVTDDYYALLDDGEGSNILREEIDLAVGRFTCRTAAEANLIVTKTIAYLANTEVGSWKNRIVVMGDDIDGGEHMEDADLAAASIENATENKTHIKKVYWDAYPRTTTATGYTYPQVTKLLQSLMDEGALMFNYSGHGSPNQLSHGTLLTTSDFESLTTSRLPLWVIASCEIFPYDTHDDNIGRASLLNDGSGVIAMLCASRAVYSNYNNYFNRSFCGYALTVEEGQRSYTMGEANMLAKIYMVTSSQDRTINKLKYIFAGDPAVALATPTGHVVVDSINGTALSDLGDTMLRLPASSIATFSGYVEETDGGGTIDNFSGIVTGTLFDRQDTIQCLDNGNTATTDYVYTTYDTQLYESSDSVKQGRFSLSIPIPVDIAYTDAAARLYLYAVNTAGTLECHGYNSDFCLNGTNEESTDTIGPDITIRLNSPDFVSGSYVDANPVFYAVLSDSSGINASGNGLGHDMELTIDGDAANAYVLNDYFSYDFGTHQSGSLTYALEGIEEGSHSLTFRAWDINNNSSTASLSFVVRSDVGRKLAVYATENPASTKTTFIATLPEGCEGGTVTFEVFNLMGRCMWAGQTTAGDTYATITWNCATSAGALLTQGIYLYRVTLDSLSVSDRTKAKKLIINN